MNLQYEALAVLVIASDVVRKISTDDATKEEATFELDNATMRAASGNRYTVEMALKYSTQAAEAIISALMMRAQNPGSWMCDDPLCVLKRVHELIRDCLRAWLKEEES